MAHEWTDEQVEKLIRMTNTNIKPKVIAEKLGIPVKDIYKKTASLRDAGQLDPKNSSKAVKLAKDKSDKAAPATNKPDSNNPDAMIDFKTAANAFKETHEADLKTIRTLRDENKELTKKLRDAQAYAQPVNKQQVDDLKSMVKTQKTQLAIVTRERDDLKLEKQSVIESLDCSNKEVERLNKEIQRLTDECEACRSTLAKKTTADEGCEIATLESSPLYFLNTDEQELIKVLISQVLYNLVEREYSEKSIYSRIFSAFQADYVDYIENIKLMGSILEAIDNSQGEDLELEHTRQEEQ